MLMRTDPFRELDRLAQQVLGTAARPAAMPMDAWREDQDFVVAFDLPGVNVDSINLDVEQNVLTVRAERPDPAGQDTELIASERPRGVFSRQLILGDTLDTENVKASYDGGVLTVRIPVTEKARPRRIEIETKEEQHQIGA
jgi:HSP20 family protein